nr:MAG TPA: hypothetical protein [Caudoviricetes sp.]
MERAVVMLQAQEREQDSNDKRAKQKREQW